MVLICGNMVYHTHIRVHIWHGLNTKHRQLVSELCCDAISHDSWLEHGALYNAQYSVSVSQLLLYFVYKEKKRAARRHSDVITWVYLKELVYQWMERSCGRLQIVVFALCCLLLVSLSVQSRKWPKAAWCWQTAAVTAAEKALFLARASAHNTCAQGTYALR